MIPKTILPFLSELKANNNREWFSANKDKYDIARKSFEKIVIQLIPEIAKIDKSIGMIEAKDCIFRIHRDIRFSNDKTPYKPNFGAYISRGGRNGGFAGYYFHLEDNQSFVSGGIYMPMPNVLKAIRTEIFENIDEYIKIVEDKIFKKLFGAVQYGDTENDKLKTAPKGFPKDFKYIEWLKYKNYYCMHNLSNNDLNHNKLLDKMVEIYTAMVPFNLFFNRVIEEM